MLYVLSSEIKIGSLVFTSIHDVEIVSTFKELTDTATIQLPRNLTLKGKSIREWIKPKAEVIIKLGYNGNLVEEFTGYVREVEPGIPLVIFCEDEMYMLKGKTLTHSWASVTLKELIEFIAPGYQLALVDPKMNLGKFQIDGASPAQVLESLREPYRLYSFFRGKVLHVGFAYQFTGYQKHNYDFQKNVRGSSLKYKTAAETRIRVKAIANPPKGKKIIEYLGDPDGELRTLNYGDLSREELKRQATQELKHFKLDGYQGDVTGWGCPVTRHGDVLDLRDKRYPENESGNFIDGVRINFHQDGYKRTNSLGPVA